MSMGYSSASVYTITPELISKIFPDEFKAFESALVKCEDRSDAMRQLSYDDYDDLEDTGVVEAYDKLQTAFKSRTGLSLYAGYHDSETDGSTYDELDGEYWSLDGVSCYTREAKSLLAGFGHDAIELKHFVTFG